MIFLISKPSCIIFLAVQHERATRTFIKQKTPSFLHHPHHGAPHHSLTSSLAGALHHSHPQSSPLQGSPTSSETSHNLSSIANLTGLPVNSAAAAALLAAHSHHPSLTSAYHASAIANLHNQTSHHLLGGSGSGLLPHLSQYFSSGSGGTSGAANGHFGSYIPLAAHLKAAFPSIFPQLYVHTQTPPIFSPPPMIPPPPLISPQRPNLTQSISSGLLRSSPTNQIPTSMVARKEREGKETEKAFSITSLAKTHKLESEREKSKPFESRIEDNKDQDVSIEDSQSPSLKINNNEVIDVDKSFQDRLNKLFSKPNDNGNNDTQHAETCGEIKRHNEPHLIKHEGYCQEYYKKGKEKDSPDDHFHNSVKNRDKGGENGLENEYGSSHKENKTEKDEDKLEITRKYQSLLQAYTVTDGKNFPFNVPSKHTCFFIYCFFA